MLSNAVYILKRDSTALEIDNGNPGLICLFAGDIVQVIGGPTPAHPNILDIRCREHTLMMFVRDLQECGEVIAL